MFRTTIMAGVIALAGTFQGAAPGPVYDCIFDVGQPAQYTGTSTFKVDAKGAVTGVMKLTAPVGVDGQLAGTIKDGTWTFTYPYQIPEQSCAGTVTGTGKVPADKKLISGTMTIDGACVEAPITGTFTFKLQEKK